MKPIVLSSLEADQPESPRPSEEEVSLLLCVYRSSLTQLLPVALDPDSFPCSRNAERVQTKAERHDCLSFVFEQQTAQQGRGGGAGRFISQLAIKCAH